MTDPKYPKVGDLHIDVTDIKVVPIYTDEVSKLSKTRPGFEVAVECFLRLTPELMDRSGINPVVAQKAAELMATNNRCLEVLPAAEKLVELLRETRLHARHELAGILTEVGAQARRRAERDPNGTEILAALEELLDYQYGPAAKAIATKIKAKKTPKAPEAPEAPEAPAEHPAQ
jgi:hypothetical protein